MSNEKSTRPQILTPGTSACALFGGLLGVLIAVLLLTIGFWKTLMIAVFFLIGAFIGGVGDKKAFISGQAEKYFPQKELHPYKADDVRIKVAPKAETEEEPAEEEPVEEENPEEEILKENAEADEEAAEEEKDPDGEKAAVDGE